MSEVLECVIFSTMEGVDRTRFIEAAEASMDWVRQQDGFVSRDLCETDAGAWIDTVHWSSMEAALAAAELIGGAAETQAFVSMIDGPSVQMMHARPVVTA